MSNYVDLLTAANEIKRDLAEYGKIDGAAKRLESLIKNSLLLADAYLAEQSSKPAKFACDHCGAFFRVEVVGVHHPKRGVVMCPFCGNEPKKVEEK